MSTHHRQLKKTRAKGWQGLTPSCDDRVSVYGEATQTARARLLEEWNNFDQDEAQLKDGHLTKQQNKVRRAPWTGGGGGGEGDRSTRRSGRPG